MAIYLDKLQSVSDFVESKRYLYKDLKLDVQKRKQFNPVIEEGINANDIDVWYDKDAIFVSLRNLFTTVPGQRFLFPKYGLDLRKYLFQPINEVTGRSIGEEISQAIKRFEPRVTLKQCNIVGKPDLNQYEIDVIVELPVFNTISTLSTVLDVKTEKFTFIN